MRRSHHGLGGVQKIVPSSGVVLSPSSSSNYATYCPPEWRGQAYATRRPDTASALVDKDAFPSATAGDLGFCVSQRVVVLALTLSPNL